MPISRSFSTSNPTLFSHQFRPTRRKKIDYICGICVFFFCFFWLKLVGRILQTYCVRQPFEVPYFDLLFVFSSSTNTKFASPLEKGAGSSQNYSKFTKISLILFIPCACPTFLKYALTKMSVVEFRFKETFRC